MDVEIEKKIVDAFIFKNKRKRFFFEMTRNDREFFGELPKSRFNAICRLERIVDISFQIMISSKFPSIAGIIETMTAHGVEKKCYVLSEYKDLDGIYVDLCFAVEKLNQNGFPSLIVGLPSGFSHLKFESYASYQPNCFLKPKVRFDDVPW